MALTVLSENTTLMDGAEDQLVDSLTAGLYVVRVDVNALVRGRDALELRCYTAVLGGGTARLCSWGYGALPQGAGVIVHSPPIPSDVEFKATLKQPSGTNQSIPWSVLSLGTPTVVASGTSTPGNVLTSLTSQSSSGLYQLLIDTNAMVNGDELLVQISDEVRSSGGTERVGRQSYYKNAQLAPVKCSPVVPANVLCEAKIQQTAGTSRAFPWKLVSLPLATATPALPGMASANLFSPPGVGDQIPGVT